MCDDRSSFPPLLSLSHISAMCFFSLLVSFGIFMADTPTVNKEIKPPLGEALDSFSRNNS